MQAILRHAILIHFLCFLGGCDGLGKKDVHSRRLDLHQNRLLQNAVKDLLGFKNLPSVPRHRHFVEQSKLKNQDFAPLYMKQLYKKYKYGGISKGSSKGNTVRSIHSYTGFMHGVPRLMFNLSFLGQSEKVFNAEIHFYRHQDSKNNTNETTAVLRKPYMVLQELVGTKLGPELDVLRLGRSRMGWQAYDVTNSIQRCVRSMEKRHKSRRKDTHLFAVHFRWGRGPRSELIPLREFTQGAMRPFLVLFSNDTQLIELDLVRPRLEGHNPRQTFVHPESGGHVSFGGGRHQRRKRQHRFHGNLEVDDGRRSRRDTPDNIDVNRKNRTPKKELYDLILHTKDEQGNSKLYKVKKKTLPAESQPPALVGPTTPSHSVEQPSSTSSIESEEKESKVTDPRLIPYPPGWKKRQWRKRMRQRRRNRKRGRRQRQRHLPFLKHHWELSDDSYTAKHARDSMCSKRRLVVDFSDIGWSDWIISPRSFEAHYCSGQCPFPMNKRVRPSNHATIQSLVHYIGLHDNVPAPCCVPDVMSSVTLLYFDESANVVLKNYPGMSVQSCACR